MSGEYLKKILNARVYEVARVTPMEIAPDLSEQLGCRIRLKREDLQPVFSFKLRGAYNKIAHLDQTERNRGVIAASAGNHAQGVALAAAREKIRAVIVMPATTPEIKVSSVQSRGAEVILHGDDFDTACRYALKLGKREGLTFVHPYDDPLIIAGQGTVGMEILQQHPGTPTAIFVPVGGGGLIAGIAAFVKELQPQVKIIGVEADDSACLYKALAAGKRVTLPKVGIFADGAAVSQIGEEPFRLARNLVDEVITVNTDEICAAIKDIFNETRSIAEPAGAMALAGLKRYVVRQSAVDEDLVAILSGANINFNRLRYISERTEVGAGGEALLAVKVSDYPGSIRDFCTSLEGYPVTELNYRYSNLVHANFYVGVGLGGVRTRERLLNQLELREYPVLDLTDNESAKVFLRYMVGGHPPELEHEKVFGFTFPERPGALLDFLRAVSGRWFLTLFHYRNHGAAYGQVLVGMSVPEKERDDLYGFLDQTGYDYTEETDNPACQIFLGVH
ncbi:MAG: threonine ammonia-lyase, biosynthetic [Acidobacteriota bacterium]|nr:threonine ammonia-lyase, biosynthetic [Acidobacteriota bacterium]